MGILLLNKGTSSFTSELFVRQNNNFMVLIQKKNLGGFEPWQLTLGNVVKSAGHLTCHLVKKTDDLWGYHDTMSYNVLTNVF